MIDDAHKKFIAEHIKVLFNQFRNIRKDFDADENKSIEIFVNKYDLHLKDIQKIINETQEEKLQVLILQVLVSSFELGVILALIQQQKTREEIEESVRKYIR